MKFSNLSNKKMPEYKSFTYIQETISKSLVEQLLIKFDYVINYFAIEKFAPRCADRNLNITHQVVKLIDLQRKTNKMLI